MSCVEALNAPKPKQPDLKTVLVSAAALVDKRGHVLLAQRPDGKPMAGLWEFPGGKVEAGELPEYALMRELEEELGIETRPTCFFPIGFASHSYESFHLLMPLFVCRMWRGDITAKEHKTYEWVNPIDMMDYPMPEADIPLISVLREMI